MMSVLITELIYMCGLCLTEDVIVFLFLQMNGSTIILEVAGNADLKCQ